MAQVIRLTPYDEVVQLFVQELEQAGIPFEAAYWTEDDVDRWRLFLVMKPDSGLDLQEFVQRVVNVKRAMYDRLPEIFDITTKSVRPDHPVAQALGHYHGISPQSPKTVKHVWGADTVVERALILKAA